MSKKLTVEETIEILCGINCDLCFDETDNPRGNEALDEAVGLLERLIPKKPTDKRILVEDTKFSIGECPNCGDKTNSDFKHCEHCGQMLDWSEQ